MRKKCKIKKCGKSVKAQGFCLKHYVQYIKKEIDINGSPVIRSKVRLPKFWLNQSIKTKSKFLYKENNIDLLYHIMLKDTDTVVKEICKKRISELGYNPPETDSISCKVSGCKSKSRSDPFIRGFCHKHYCHFINGIIDEDGNQIREIVPLNNRKSVKCKVHKCLKNAYKRCFCEQHYIEFRKGMRDIHGKKLYDFEDRDYEEMPLSRINIIIRELASIKKKIKHLRNNLFLDDTIEKDFNLQLSVIDDNLKFINNPSFILGCMSFMENKTLRDLLGGEKDEPMKIDIQLTDDKKTRKFEGVLIKGKNANVAITEYELINKKKKTSDTVLFLKDIIDSKFPFECKASDIKGNIVHHVKIMESK